MRRRKLLIADDSEMNRAILANVLDQEFEVIEGPVANALLLTTCLSMLTVPLMTSLFNFL